MPKDARRNIVRQGEVGTYHCWSRCVQRAFLCGYDDVTKTDFNYRRAWMEDLLEYQAGIFAIDVGSYNILSNHTHAVLRTRPDLAAVWSDENVAWRWKMAWPWFDGKQWSRNPTDQEIKELLTRPDKIAEIRDNLSSLSWFMARWKEPIARVCNSEMKTTGHFWEARFASRELLDEAAVLTCSMYVDLNQVKAEQALSLIDSEHSAIRKRILAAKQREAKESLAAFEQQDRSNDYLFPGSVAQTLFEDCWLSPISPDGALITDEAKQQSEAIRIDADEHAPAKDLESKPAKRSESQMPKASEGAEEVDPKTKETNEPTTGRSSGATTQPDSENQSSDQSKQTRPATRRRRASDSPFIAVPWPEYFRVVQGLAAIIVAGGATPKETDVGGRVLEEVAQTLRNWGMNPAPWVGRINEFADHCRSVLGTAEHVEARAEQANKRCYFGINYCRDVFAEANSGKDEFT